MPSSLHSCPGFVQIVGGGVGGRGVGRNVGGACVGGVGGRVGGAGVGGAAMIRTS